MKDTIYRQDAIETVHHSIFDFFKNSENEEKFLTERDKLLLSINKAICNKIKGLPSAERVGKWIESTTKMTFMCSECGRGFYGALNFDYCPHCGARMEEE